ncbi:hypothetical protein ABZY58_11970 [Micromonospora tulbaghiae]|uniref:hypothetical protein n=1 Tax=Micromonospora tulbaghiae TaxID=479978 RepID=UPI0033ADE76F
MNNAAERTPSPPCTGTRHGDALAYTRYRCRCPEGREAYRVYRKRLREGRQPAANIRAVGTARRLQALMAIGWARAELARQLGLSEKRVSQLTFNTDGNVHWRTAAKVRALYKELSATPGPEKRAIYAADRHRFAPPAAWDNIDDPNETPYVRAPRHEADGRVLVRRVLAGNAAIHILTFPEQVSLWRQWVEQRQAAGRGSGPGCFADQFGIGERRAARIRQAATEQTNEQAADSRTDRKVA